MKLSDLLREHICGCGDHLPDEYIEQAKAADAVIAEAKRVKKDGIWYDAASLSKVLANLEAHDEAT